MALHFMFYRNNVTEKILLTYSFSIVICATCLCIVIYSLYYVNVVCCSMLFMIIRIVVVDDKRQCNNSYINGKCLTYSTVLFL